VRARARRRETDRDFAAELLRLRAASLSRRRLLAES
jgi:hypothetical protein